MSTSVSEYRVYVPFLDGTIGYDCATCQSRCCRAGYIGARTDEKRFLLEQHPGLATFEAGSRGNYTIFKKSQPSCWFLQTDGLCSLETRFGRDRKPHVCRSHPIYLTPLPTQRIVLTVVSWRCVWLTDDLSTAIGTLTWDEVNALHAECVDHSLYEAMPITSVLGRLDSDHLGPYVGPLIDAEEYLRDLAARTDSLDEFLAHQMAFTELFLDHLDARQVTVTEADLARSRRALAELRSTLHDLLGQQAPPLPRAVARRFMLFAPMLRLELLNRYFATTRRRGDLLQVLARLRQYFDLLPRVLLVLAEKAAAYTLVDPGARADIDIRTVFGFLHDFPERLAVLARLTDTVDVPSFVKPSQLPASLAGLCAARGDRPLGEILLEACADQPVGRRLEVVDQVARLVQRIHQEAGPPSDDRRPPG
jgi:hypothetical protein